jgi:hypothetical protein
MKPSGKVELLIISIRNPYSHATVPHIVALLGSTFHAANIRTLFETSKFFRKKLSNITQNHHIACTENIIIFAVQIRINQNDLEHIARQHTYKEDADTPKDLV